MFDAGRWREGCVFDGEEQTLGEAAEAGGLALEGGEVAGLEAQPGEGIGCGFPVLIEALSERADVVELDAKERALAEERQERGVGAAGLGLFGEADGGCGEMGRQYEIGAAQAVGAGVERDLGLALRGARTGGEEGVAAVGLEAGGGELGVGHG